MKNKIIKVILIAITLVMLFGSIPTTAYESYDTYTYSIDGTALPSPHAYTPDVETYDSTSMGLLAGYYWRYEEEKVAVWAGEMTPTPVTNTFFSNLIDYSWDEDSRSYVATKLLGEFIEISANVDRLTALMDGYIKSYPKVADSTEISITVENIPDFTAENVIDVAREYIEGRISEMKDSLGAEAKIAVTFEYSAIKNKLSELVSSHPCYAQSVTAVKIPALYNDGVHGEAKVTSVASGFISLDDGWTDNYSASIARTVYNKISALVVGKNIVTVSDSAFSGASKLAQVYTEADDEDFANISIGKNNSYFTSARIYYYSENIKFGNTKLAGATDIVSDHEGNLYIADTGNNRIVILNSYDYKAIGIIKTYTDEYGKTQNFSGPQGVFVTDPTIMVDGSQEIFVCDTGNRRIVVFDSNYQYVRTIEEPDSPLLSEGDFTPYAIAVDIYGRIFIVSRNCTKGIIVLSSDGEFTGFIGAQKVTTNIIDVIWDSFKSDEEREYDSLNLAVPFNNITVDEHGFVYVTINFTEKEDLSQQLSSIKSKNASYSPVKKLNSRGVEIMKRNGFFDPGGEVLTGASATYNNVSKIVDVALGNEGSWTILDSSRSRLYTYDQNGNLLFAFGDKGNQVGNGVAYVAMTYQVVEGVYNLVLTDNTPTGFQLTVYHPTEYCDTIMEALHNQNIHNYTATIDNWQEILTSNNNFDLAYIGIGKALYSQGRFEEAMEMLSGAYETDYYAKAFAEIRKDVIGSWLLLIVIGLILLVVLIVKFLGWAKKKNKAVSLKVGQKTYGEEMLYVFHLIFHPFDGFWDLKHEKRGSVRAAATILGITVLAFFYQSVGTGYMFNTRGNYSSIFSQIISVVVPVALWVVGNWCLTTLFDGEGSMKDIFVASCYSLAPLPLFVVVSTVLTNILTNSDSEGNIVSLLVTIGYIWVAILLFFGMAVTHDYSTGKNFITILGTILAMCVIMFIVILFSSLVMKMASFLISITQELINRLA